MGEKWHRVMQNLFGDQSEEEEEEVDSEHESNPHPNSVILLPCPPQYRAVTRLSIMLLQPLLSAETSTGLIKEGSTILPKHFRTITTKWCNYKQERVARANLQLLSSGLRMDGKVRSSGGLLSGCGCF
ncbi:unnamed protein product [Malus baccata var. baccata]